MEAQIGFQFFAYARRRGGFQLGQSRGEAQQFSPLLDGGIAGSQTCGHRFDAKAQLVEARDLFRRPVTPFDLKGCDAIVFDPPRAGAVEQTGQIASTKAQVVVGVSCNPQTFARDARVLIDAGFRLERVTPVDQFLWSAHVELVGVFRR